MSEREQIFQAIQTQEKLRGTLPDAVIDMTVAALREKLAGLPTAVSEQRRQVIVLFADLVSFTAISETLDVEEVRDLINLYFQAVAAPIVAYGGRVEKFIGDAVMAVFGLSQSQEHDPENAIRAALAMQEALKQVNIQATVVWGQALQMRIGIHTGPVIASFVGGEREQDFTVMGDTVNTASRLQEMAPADGILISHDVYRHIRGIFRVRSRPPLTVKGKREPLRTYTIHGVKPRPFRLGSRGVEGVETRMIGRDAELNQLQLAARALFDRGELRLITLVGEAGVGKSRLLYEFNDWLHLIPENILYFRGRSVEQTQTIPYALWRDLFAFRFQIQESDSAEVVRQKFEQGFARYVRDDNHRLMAHFLLVWLGFGAGDELNLATISQDAAQLQSQAAQYIGQFFAAVTQAGPAVIILEDIHWADAPSLTTLQTLLTHFPDLPLLVICLTRPSLFAAWPDWGRGYEEIWLKPLTEDDIHQLVDEILQKAERIPPALYNLIASRADGNPFFVEELVKMLIDDGVIATDEEPWRIADERLTDIRAPSTLTGILQARLDRLTAVEKDVLQRAAVVGRIFWDAAVRHLAHETDNLDAILTPLTTRELIFRRQETAFKGTVEFIFKHALLRDVIYESVLLRARRGYHRQVADWLAEAAQQSDRADEFATLIAAHYERGEATEQARDWYRRAGEQAARRFVHREALDALQRALALTPETETAVRYQLLCIREKIYNVQGDRLAQQADLEELSRLAGQLTLDERVEIMLRRAGYAESIGEDGQTLALARQVVEIGERTKNRTHLALAYYNWGWALIRLGRFSEARDKVYRAISFAESVGDDLLIARCLNGLGSAANQQGQLAEARTRFQESLDIYRQLEHRMGQGNLLANLGIVTRSIDGAYAARPYFRQSLAMFREMGDRRREGHVRHNLALTAVQLGDLSGAERHLETSLALIQETGDRRWEGYILETGGLVAALRGDYEQAQRCYEQAMIHYESIGNNPLLAQAECALADALAEWGELARAQTLYEQAQGRDLPDDDRAPRLMIALGLAYLAYRRADLTTAQAHLPGVLSHLQEHPDGTGLARPLRVYLLCYKMLAAAKDERAAAILTQAQAALQKLLAQIPEETVQRAFLTNIPEHRELLSYAAQA
jgi:class 3 adenylate cyclase/tetratricopeptide (TPR) repeat protein